MMNAQIFLIDMQSFYANIEKALHPQLQNQPVVISGDPKRRSGIILAACPIAKSYGIQNAIPLWEAQKRCPHLVVLRPRMQLYLDVSLRLTQILERFSDQVEPYSIDEQFIDIKGSESLFGSPDQIAQNIQSTIYKELHLNARIGMGPNKVLAKMACDHFAKKNQSGIFYLGPENIQTHLWPLPVEKCFGVGSRMCRHLQKIGIQTIGELANFPLPLLKKYWGINGHVLWMTANGLDQSPVTSQSFGTHKGIGHQITLPYNYCTSEEIEIVLLELCEEVCQRSRRYHLAGKTITVHCRNDFQTKGGFTRQVSLDSFSNQTLQIFTYAKKCFFRFWNGEPVRSIGLRLSNLRSDDNVQLNLFEDVERKRKLGYVMDQIKQQFGLTAIFWASSLLPAGQAKIRAQKIGGHFK